MFLERVIVRWGGALGLAACLLSWAAASAAQPAAPADAFQAAMSSGREQLEAKHFVQARVQFLRAHALQPSAQALRGVGVAAFELRRYAESVAYLGAALAAGDDPLAGALREDTERLRQRAQSYVAELRVQLAPARATLIVDGEAARSAGGRLWLDLGDHTLAAEAEGYASEERAYTVEGGERETIVITLSALSGPTLAGDDAGMPSPRRHKRLLRGGALLGVAGAASTGLGIWRFAEHVEDGRHVRMSGPQAIGAQRAWSDSRTAPLALVGVGAGLLTATSALVAELVPHRTRRWLSPLLLGAGTAMLATGIALSRSGERCDAHAGAALRACVLDGERRDRGIVVSVLSVPFFTMPALHALEWLRGR